MNGSNTRGGGYIPEHAIDISSWLVRSDKYERGGWGGFGDALFALCRSRWKTIAERNTTLKQE